MADHIITPRGDVVLVMSKQEARGLLAIAGEGAEGLFTDAEAASAYIGNSLDVKAAERALEELRKAAGA